MADALMLHNDDIAMTTIEAETALEAAPSNETDIFEFLYSEKREIAPTRRSDVFDFLYSKKSEIVPEECVKVENHETPDFVVVKFTTPDGRSLHRDVPAAQWNDEDYRSGLIQGMARLVA